MVVLTGVFVSMGIAAVASSLLSIYFRGQVTYEYLITGGIITCIAAFAVPSILVFIFGQSRESETHCSGMIDNSPDAMALVDPHGKILLLNRQGASLFGLEMEEQTAENNLLNFVADKERVRITRNLLRALETGRAGIIECAMLRMDGTGFYAEVSASAAAGDAGKAPALIVVVRDITERKAEEDKLRHAAHYDSATNLPNRVMFLERIQAAVARSYRQKGYMFAVMLFGLDRFQAINDGLGHAAGDQLLATVAKRLKKNIRPFDIAARSGGDVFAVLLASIRNIGDVLRVTERLHSAIKKPITINDHEIYATASIGITIGKTGQENPEDILREADTAMRKAKTLGRSCYVIFDEAMHAQATAYAQLESGLREALEKKKFVLNYQPIVLSHTNEITGFEALLRWKSPDRGMLSAAEFIPVAEETGLIVPVGNWALREACSQMRSWHEQFPGNGHLTISVNISAKQFTADLITTIRQTLAETGLSATSLKLDLTESAVIKNPDAAAELFAQLKDMKVKVQMDDFGTGLSSLGYLYIFPLDALKIDRSFIQSMCDNETTMQIVKTIISMGHAMNMEVIAEGVETLEQLMELKNLKCDYYQGYWFSRPLDREKAERLLEGQES